MILLDTNMVIMLINRTSVVARRTFDKWASQGSTIAVGSIVVLELEYGVAKSERCTFNNNLLRGFLAGPISILPFDAGDAAVAGDLRAAHPSAPTTC